MWIGHFVLLFFHFYDRSIEGGPPASCYVVGWLWLLAAVFVSAARNLHLSAFEAGGTLSEWPISCHQSENTRSKYTCKKNAIRNFRRIVGNVDIYSRGFLMSEMLVSDQRSRSRCTLSDAKHNNNNTSIKKSWSINSTRNANIDGNIFLIGHRRASYFRGFLMSGMLMSDQHWRSCCTLSRGNHNNSNASNKKARSNNSKRNVNNIHLVTKCQGVPGTTKRLPRNDESLG